ncbi:sugar ABC transporter substrate-binding protein [Halanaerocella petrolearia]
MKKVYSFLLIISLIITGCNLDLEEINPLTSPPPAKKKITIGVSIAEPQAEISKIIKKAFIKNEIKNRVKIIWKNTDNKLEEQKKDINNLIKQKVDAIIIKSLNTGKKGTKIIKTIKEANIPIIALDKLPNNTDVDAFISANNFKIGQLQARYLIDQIDKKGKLIILKGEKEDKIAKDITKGNKEEIKKYKKVKIVKETWHTNWSEKLAAKTIQEILKNNKDIKGILANNDQLALEAIKIIQNKKFNQQITIVGANASKEGTAAIKKELLNATIDKMPYIRALNSLKVATFIARDEKWNWDNKISNGPYNIKLVTTPVKLINKYNIHDLQQRWENIHNKKKE